MGLTERKAKGLLKRSQKEGFNSEFLVKSFNPMEEFTEYVSTKEVVHTKILSELLDPQGSHGLGTSFIFTFLKRFIDKNISRVNDIKVEKEKSVKRVLTKGGDRSIDIFIEFTESIESCQTNSETKKSAIIIENKLNNADYEVLQLEDYYLAIKQELRNGESVYGNIYILSFHKCWSPEDFKMEVEGVKVKVLYPQDLGVWLEESISIWGITKAYTVIAYATYLKNLHIINRMEENNKILFNFDPTLLRELQPLVKSFDSVMNNRLQFIKEAIEEELPDNKYEYKELTNYIEIKVSNTIKHSLSVMIWKWDEFQNSIYIAYKGNNEPDDFYLQKADYKSNNEEKFGYKWYISKDINKITFSYPGKGVKLMVKEIVKLLKILEN